MKHLYAVAGVLLMSPVLYAQSVATKESLRGLDGVYINVLKIDAEVERAGMTRRQVREKVEAQLRGAGIPIHEKPQPAAGDANLGIVVDIVKSPQFRFRRF
jgi:hypothetical protein